MALAPKTLALELLFFAGVSLLLGASSSNEPCNTFVWCFSRYLVGVCIAVPARIWTLYVTTDLRELRDGRRPSVLGVSGWTSGMPTCAPAVGLAEASSYSSVVCSSFVISDMMLAPSSRLVGGVEMGGD